MTSEQQVPVVIIGAGQAGLAVAYYLRRFQLVAGQDFVMLDRGPSAGGAWQNRWSALRLGSAHRVHDLPGMDQLGISFDTADRSLPAREVVSEYYARYETFFELDVRRPVQVRSVRNDGADLAVEFDGVAAVQPGVSVQPGVRVRSEASVPRGFFGRRSTVVHEPQPVRRIKTQVVVNATGTWGSPFLPHYPGMEEFAGRHVHTANYQSAEDFRGLSVVVVGGGTSAVGFMLELESVASQLTWVSRRPLDWVDGQELDLEGAVTAVALHDEAARQGQSLPSIVSGTGVPKSRRIAAGIARGLLVAHPMFDRIAADRVVWEKEIRTEIPADAIIWATGFRPELRHLAPLKLREKAGGVTVESATAGRDPRVFFAGYGPAASTVGANRAGRLIARHIMAMI